MNKIAEKLKEELKTLIPAALFFFIALHILSFVRFLMLKGTGITIRSSVSATIAAMIIAKAVLIADKLPFINLYPHKPLIYNVTWKTMLYMLVAMVIQYMERLFSFSRAAGGLVAGNEKLLSEIVWPHFWAVQILLAILLFMFCTWRELIRVIGKDKVRDIFFRAPKSINLSS